MNQILHDAHDRAEKILSSLECDYAEIRCAAGSTTSISFAGNQVEEVMTGNSVGGSVRVYHRGAWGFVSFNSLDSMSEYAKRALHLASLFPGEKRDPFVSGSPVHLSKKTTVTTPLDQVDLDTKVSLISGYNDIIRGADAVQTTRAVYRDQNVDSIYMNTEGSDVTYQRSFCGVALSSIAKDGNVMQPYGDSVAGYGGFELVENRQEMAEDVVKTAVDLLKAESIQGGTYNIVVDPRLAGVFIHEAFGHLSEADFVYENERMKDQMVLGRQFGPDFLNIIDDGSIEGLTGYIPCDDEGILPRKTYLIREGILRSRLHSRETAAAMGEEPSGNARAISSMTQPIVRMTNTYIDNGTSTREDLFASLSDGLYVVNALGGQTNLEMFTFSPAYAVEVKNGKLGKMFKDVMLSGNVFTTMKNIDMVANDRKMFGGLGGCGKKGQSPLPVSLGGPHVLIKNVLIGGKQA